MAVPDAELIARAKRGELEAFGHLIERYEKTLLAVVIADLRDFHTAEDVVQSTMLLAFRRLETLRDERKFGPWLMQIARRQSVDAVRARQVPAKVPLNSAEHITADDAAVQTWIENEHLLNLVAQLPEHERTVIGLRYFDGHSMAEIAAILAIPVGTVTKQISRAIARLHSWWDTEKLR